MRKEVIYSVYVTIKIAKLTIVAALKRHVSITHYVCLLLRYMQCVLNKADINYMEQ
jgi:hypothetical protein